MTVKAFAEKCGNFVTAVVLVVASIYFVIGLSARPQRTVATRPFPIPGEPVPIANTPVEGDAHAKVGMIEFSDFQCGYCGRFAVETLPILKADYVDTGLMAVSFRNFPEADTHPDSVTLAEAGVCAGAQGRFWSFHDRMFASPGNTDRVFVSETAKELGLSMTAFERCLLHHDYDALDQDQVLARRLGINVTPTFFVGLMTSDRRVRVSEVIVGAERTGVFTDAIDRVMKSAAHAP
jgi:protein-disulfide isomerase